MIELYQFTNFKKPDPSPFAVKVELYLKANKLPYSIKAGDVRKAPKKKFPMIIDGETVVCDSEHIIEYLNKKYSINMDSHLSKEERAISFAFKKMMEEHLYFIGMYFKWVDERYWPETKKAVFGKLPVPLQFFVPGLVRKNIIKTLYMQGTGRHSQKEIYDFGAQALDQLQNFLGNKSYFMGEKISSLDLSCFGTLYNILQAKSDTEMSLAFSKHQNLVQYTNRILETYYSGK